LYLRDKPKALYYLDRYLKMRPDDAEMLRIRPRLHSN